MFGRFASMDIVTFERELERLRVLQCSPEAFRVSPSGTPPPISHTADEIGGSAHWRATAVLPLLAGRVPDAGEARLLFSWPEDEQAAYASRVRH